MVNKLCKNTLKSYSSNTVTLQHFGTFVNYNNFATICASHSLQHIHNVTYNNFATISYEVASV